MTIIDPVPSVADQLDSFAALLDEHALEVVVPEGDQVGPEGETLDMWWFVVLGSLSLEV